MRFKIEKKEAALEKEAGGHAKHKFFVYFALALLTCMINIFVLQNRLETFPVFNTYVGH